MASSPDRLLADARHLLRGWPDGAVEDTWASLCAAVGAWKIEHGERRGLDAVDWIELMESYLPLLDLLGKIRQIEARAGRRNSKPLPRLYAVVVLKAVTAKDGITALKAIGSIRESLAQARRRSGASSNDVVTRLATEYLRAKPSASNRQVFEHVQGLADCHDLFFEPDAEEESRRRGPVLDYLPHRAAKRSKVIDFILFSKRMHKIRRRLGLARSRKNFQEDFAFPVSAKSGMPSSKQMT